MSPSLAENYKTRLLICLMSIFPIMCFATLNKLTPERHPKNNRFYVCYANRSLQAQDNFSRYYLYHYHGCLITKMPCKYKSGKHQHKFGQFDTYPLALNAYFRCAYS